jgi:hypothetical protein
MCIGTFLESKLLCFINFLNNLCNNNNYNNISNEKERKKEKKTKLKNEKRGRLFIMKFFEIFNSFLYGSIDEFN